MGTHKIDTKSSSKKMYSVSWRSVMAHKVRLVLTILAVVLGTAFVSGSMMFTNALGDTFKSVVDDEIAGVDAYVVSGEEAVTTDVLAGLREDSQVAKVNVNGSKSVVLANSEREPYQTGAAGPTMTIWYNAEDTVGGTNPQIVEGAQPEAENEVVVNESAANNFDIKVGDSLLVVDEFGQYNVTVSGLYTIEGASHPSINLAMTEGQYLTRYAGDGTLGSLLVSANGVSDTELVEHLEATYPGLKISTGEAFAELTTNALNQVLSFVNYFLVAFGLIALLVGTFIIANTFSMIVAQRLREFALLRALGVSRGQLTKSVVFESVIVGAIGSALGILGGMGLVLAIQGIMNAFGMELPSTSLGLSTTSVLVPFVLGVVVTVVSAWAPARKAGAVRPVEAMRSTETSSESSLKLRTVFGLIGLAAGIALALFGALNEDPETKVRAILVGFGALFVILGVFLASPALSIPLVGGIGRVVGAPFGEMGKLAATNSRRNPRRTATTAFALTLGVALVTAIGMISATMRESVSDYMETESKADFVATSASQAINFPSEAVQTIRDTDGVGATMTSGWATATVASAAAVNEAAAADGEETAASASAQADVYVTTGVTTADSDVSQLININDAQGSMDLSEAGRMIANADYAKDQGWAIGGTLSVLDSAGNQVAEATLEGTYGDQQTMGNVVVSAATFDNTGITPMIVGVFIDGDDSVSNSQLRENLENAVADYLVVQIQTSEEYAGEAVSAVNTIMNIIYGLLGLAVVVAVLGIINTLALNVIERRQEIGMLRAVGSQRRQIRRMILVESVQIALYGAVVGMLVGLGLGWCFLKVLAGQGLDSISVPYSELVWLLVGSGVVGVIAALWPASRAAKTPPLEAITD